MAWLLISYNVPMSTSTMAFVGLHGTTQRSEVHGTGATANELTLIMPVHLAFCGRRDDESKSGDHPSSD